MKSQTASSSNSMITALFTSSRFELRKYVRRLVRSDETADDIVQEAFLKTLQNADKMEIPRAFLFTVARNLALDSRRHDNIVKFEVIGDMDELIVEGKSVDLTLEAGQQRDLLKQAINHLSPKCRAVYTCRVFLGMSYREISKRYHISEKTVENQIAVGLRETTKFLRGIHHE